MSKAPALPKKAPAAATAVPPGLSAASRREIAEGQSAMRALIAQLPRRFGYADEVDFSFRPDHGE